MCAIEPSILIDSLAPAEISSEGGQHLYLQCRGWIHEIEIESIDVTRKADGCRRMHYYNGKFFLMVRFAWIAWNSDLPMP